MLMNKWARAATWTIFGVAVGLALLAHGILAATLSMGVVVGVVMQEMYHRARVIIDARSPRRLEETRLLLARCLADWQEESGEGDGISEEYSEDFEAACALLGIAVVTTGVAYGCTSYRCEPTFEKWLAANPPRKGLA